MCPCLWLNVPEISSPLAFTAGNQTWNTRDTIQHEKSGLKITNKHSFPNNRKVPSSEIQLHWHIKPTNAKETLQGRYDTGCWKDQAHQWETSLLLLICVHSTHVRIQIYYNISLHKKQGKLVSITLMQDLPSLLTDRLLQGSLGLLEAGQY